MGGVEGTAALATVAAVERSPARRARQGGFEVGAMVLTARLDTKIPARIFSDRSEMLICHLFALEATGRGISEKLATLTTLAPFPATLIQTAFLTGCLCPISTR